MKHIRFPKDKIVWLLLIVSLAVYVADFFIFHRADEIFFGFMSNLSFLPVYVLFVTLMVERVLKEREREAKMKKLNMVIGVFFSEVGVELLRKISRRDPDITELRQQVDVTNNWTDNDFTGAKNGLKNHKYKVIASPEDLQDIKALVISHRAQLVQLLENPILLEHEEFTSLLRAVFHLSEELDYRKSLEGLPKSDYIHLSGDAARAYGLLTREWLSYMKYLKVHYPYLFSLSIRTNPFKEEAMPVVRE